MEKCESAIKQSPDHLFAFKTAVRTLHKSPQNLCLELANLLLGATVRLPDDWDDVHLDVNPDDDVHLDVHHQHDVHLHVHPDEDVHSNVHHRDNVHIYINVHR